MVACLEAVLFLPPFQGILGWPSFVLFIEPSRAISLEVATGWVFVGFKAAPFYGGSRSVHISSYC